LQRVAACCSVLHRGALCFRSSWSGFCIACTRQHARVLKCVASCCSMLQRVAVLCIVVHTGGITNAIMRHGSVTFTTGCCSVLQRVAVYCIRMTLLMHTCVMSQSHLWHSSCVCCRVFEWATVCCSGLQHVASHLGVYFWRGSCMCVSSHTCIAHVHITTHSNTSQHTATHDQTQNRIGYNLLYCSPCHFLPHTTPHIFRHFAARSDIATHSNT